LKLRRDLTLISAVLFTTALLATVPTSLHMAAVLPHRTPAPVYYSQLEPIGELGITSLAMVAIGLIVIWTEYLKNSKSAWFVLLVIAFGWAFPVRLLVFIIYENKSVSVPEWLSGVLTDPYIGHVFALSILICLLMVIALLLPTRSFFRRRRGDLRG
jgi:branched-subunit amino acid ABC-type transport system permease component